VNVDADFVECIESPEAEETAQEDREIAMLKRFSSIGEDATAAFVKLFSEADADATVVPEDSGLPSEKMVGNAVSEGTPETSDEEARRAVYSKDAIHSYDITDYIPNPKTLVFGAIKFIGLKGAKETVEHLGKEALEGAGKAATRGINPTQKGLAHVAARHLPGGAKIAGKSLFGASEDISALARAAQGVTPVLQRGGNFARTLDAGRGIGIDRATGQATSFYTVITNAADELITMFPGRP
jgi:hypothetical protein